jgi:hypothetical protein
MMAKMKGGLLILLMVVVSALIFSGLALGASIDYLSSGFYSQTQSLVSNNAGGESVSEVDSGWDAQDLYTYSWASLEESVTVDSSNFCYQEGSDNNRNVQVSAAVYGDSNEPGGKFYINDGGVNRVTYGNAATLQPTVTDGIFFKINPSVGESVGDPVLLSWEWYCEAYVQGIGIASFFGGYDEGMAITINGTPVWSRAGFTQSEEYNGGDYGDYPAHIGDTIGVYLGVAATFADVPSEGYSFAESRQYVDLYVNPVPVPPTAWLLGSGILGLWLLRRRRFTIL